MTEYEALIIGAGPAGLMAAQTLGRQRRRVLLVDDGRPRNAPAAAMHMYLSRDGIAPAELRRYGREELTAYPSVSQVAAHVETVEGSAGGFTAQLDGGPVGAAVLLLATGVEDLVPDLPGLPERWGRGVYHCGYCHGFESTGRRIVVLANSPQDAMLAYYLHDRFSEEVLLLLNGHRPDAGLRAMVEGAGVAVIETPVRAITGQEPDLEVQLTDGATVAAELVFHRPATRQRSDLAARLGCTLSDTGTVPVDQMLRTSVAGVYAAGDCAGPADTPGPTTFVTSAVGDGQRAAVWMEQDLLMASLPRG